MLQMSSFASGMAARMEETRARGFSAAASPAPQGDAHPLSAISPMTHNRWMCNDYEQHVRWAEYCKMMQELELGIPTQQTELDLPQADDVRINDRGPVMRAAGNDIGLVSMNFSFPPARPEGKPVFNFRSERRSFAKSNRCLIPVVCLLRIHREALPREQAPFRAARRAFHGDRRGLARKARQTGVLLCNADDRARPRRRPLPRPPGRGVATVRLGALISPHAPGVGAFAPAASRIVHRRDCADRSRQRGRLTPLPALASRAPVAATCRRSAPLAQPLHLLRNRQFSETIWNAAAQAVMSRAGRYAPLVGRRNPYERLVPAVRRRTP